MTEDEILLECVSCVLNNVRDDRKLSKTEVSRRAGLDRKAVGYAENEGFPRMRTFVRICRALEVRPSEIMMQAEMMMTDYVGGKHDYRREN